MSNCPFSATSGLYDLEYPALKGNGQLSFHEGSLGIWVWVLRVVLNLTEEKYIPSSNSTPPTGKIQKSGAYLRRISVLLSSHSI